MLWLAPCRQVVERRIARIDGQRRPRQADPGRRRRRGGAAIDAVGHAGDRQGCGLAGVGVARPAQQVAAERSVALVGQRRQRSRHHRRIVGAGDGDGLALRHHGAMHVDDVVADHDALGGARRQMVERRIARIDGQRRARQADPGRRRRRGGAAIDAVGHAGDRQGCGLASVGVARPAQQIAGERGVALVGQAVSAPVTTGASFCPVMLKVSVAVAVCPEVSCAV